MIVTVYLSGGPFDNELHPMIWREAKPEPFAYIGSFPRCVYRDTGRFVNAEQPDGRQLHVRRYTYIGRYKNGFTLASQDE